MSKNKVPASHGQKQIGSQTISKPAIWTCSPSGFYPIPSAQYLAKCYFILNRYNWTQYDAEHLIHNKKTAYHIQSPPHHQNAPLWLLFASGPSVWKTTCGFLTFAMFFLHFSCFLLFVCLLLQAVAMVIIYFFRLQPHSADFKSNLFRPSAEQGWPLSAGHGPPQ